MPKYTKKQLHDISGELFYGTVNHKPSEIAWKHFHTAQPLNAIRQLGSPLENTAAMYHLFASVLEKSLRYLPIPDDKFHLLPTSNFVQVDSDPSNTYAHIDRKALMSIQYSKFSAYVMEVNMIRYDGVSQVATLWIQNGFVELFNPFGSHASTLYRFIDEKLIPLLNKKWAHTKLRTFIYKLPIEQLTANNLWNPLFISMRMQASRERVSKAFSQIKNERALQGQAGKLVVALGKIIGECTKARMNENDNRTYRSLFGPNAETPLPLTSETFSKLLPTMISCKLPESKLWSEIAISRASSDAENESVVLRVDTKWPAGTDKKWLPFMEIEGSKKPIFVTKK